MTIFDDILKDVRSRLTRKNLQKAERAGLEALNEVKNRETLRGRSPARDGLYNNTYSKQYARREKGGRLRPVTLRNRTRAIEETLVKEGTRWSEMKFRDRKKGIIFFWHHTGTAKGGKTRQVYPENDNQVPPEVDEAVAGQVDKILNE